MNMLIRKEIVLRDYQEKTISMARDAIAAYKKIVIQLSTGAGKTVIATHILKQVASRGIRCCFVVDRLTLINQTSMVFSQYGIPHGVIQGQHERWRPEELVQIASIQTLSRRSYEDFPFIIIDEIHTLHTEHKKMLSNCTYAIGLSATPWRKGLGKHFKKLIRPVGMRELINKGHLLDFRVYGPRTINTDGLRTVAGDFVESELAERADTVKITGDIVTHWKKHATGRKTICFCVNIAHARHVSREFNRNGIKSVEVNSYQRAEGEGNERQQALDEFVEGDAMVICSVDILGKGFDDPETSCVILARPTKSLMVHVQQVGRGLRVGGNNDCLILDHAGNTERLGFVDEIDISILDDGKSKKSSKEKERKEPLPTPCVSCEFMKPARVHKCPACGFEPENIRDVDTEIGELEELKRKKTDRKEYSVSDKQNFIGGLNAYAIEKGYRRGRKGVFGWSINKFNEKFGCNPSNQIDWGYVTTANEDVMNFIKHSNIKYHKRKEKERNNN